MELVLLGTGAGEGYPGLWCNCRHCAQARRIGGKNIRSTSCAVIDETLMIDMGPQAFDRAVQQGVNLSLIRALLITHPHEDHFYPKHLLWRQTREENNLLPYEEQIHKGGPRFTDVPLLDLYGAASTRDVLDAYLSQPVREGTGRHVTTLEQLKIAFHEYHTGETFTAADAYTVQAVQGNHGPYPGFAHSFIIRKDDKTLLYALDSGEYPEESMNTILTYRYDCVVMEGTTGLNEQSGGHHCFSKNTAFKKCLEQHGCLAQGAPFVLTHLSPHWCPPHDEYQAMLDPYGITLGYDGMRITI